MSSQAIPNLAGSGAPRAAWYLPYLVLISGLGGLLAGVDFAIIAGALLYLDKTIPMTEAQQGLMVSIYFIGGLIASLFAGAMADWLGRQKAMVAGGLIFVVSILLIYTSTGFYSLLVGRTLMGLSGGIICVVVPLFMAECLPSAIRGRGTSAFQFMLTLGLFVAGLTAGYFTNLHDEAVKAAAGNADLIFAADDAAWRNMFLVAAIPGAIFTLGSFFLKESPRWLFRRGREEKALDVLRISRSEEEASRELAEIKQHTNKHDESGKPKTSDSLLQRKYVVPFILACLILALTQATGINTIIAYAAKLIQGAGFTEKQAATSFTVITIANCVFTLVGALLVDKLGRKVLLTFGTAGIIVSLFSAAMVYRQFEAKRFDVIEQVQAGLSEDGKSLEVDLSKASFATLPDGTPGQLSVLYSYITPEGKRKPGIATAFSNAEKPVLKIEPPSEKKWVTENGKKVEKTIVKDLGRLEIQRAKYGPIPAGNTGLWITVILCLFVAFFAVGPGVCVWLALTELMPTRIRSMGMGVAMVLNTGVQFLSAFFFPIVVGNQGFNAMFLIWGGCTVIYFLIATFFLPETKGKTLEEIEDYFEGKSRKKA